MDRLTAMEVFVAVAETGSFTKAAARMRMSIPMTTLHVSRLEERLGVRLFNRTTRRVDLTQEGTRLLEPARELIGGYASAERVVRPGGGLQGRVRVDAPASIGHACILPRLAEFQAAFPDIVLDLTLGDRGTVFRIDGFDIVMRVGEAPISGWVMHQLGETRQLCLASPRYLAQYGTPQSPDELTGHRCLLYASVEVPGGSPWRFREDGKSIRIRPAPAFTFNDGVALQSAARDGIGIAQQLEMVARDDMRNDRLVPLLLPWAATVRTTLMASKERLALPHVAAVMDFLATRIDWQLD